MISKGRHAYRMFSDPKELKTGDTLTIRSKQWHDRHKNEEGEVNCIGCCYVFDAEMSQWCGKKVKFVELEPGETDIILIDITGDDFGWEGWMFEEFPDPFDFQKQF